jgi:hypothetical protein
MAWTQDDADSFLKLFAQVEKRNQPSEADLKEQRRLERQKQLLEQAKQEEQDKGKSSWDKAKDFGGGVVDAGKNIVVGGADFVQETGKSVKNLVDVGREQGKESKFLEGEAAINSKYKQEADEKVWKGYENAASVDELPADRQKAWDDIQKRRKAEMADYSGKTERGDSEKTKKLFEEQKVREEDFKKAGQQFYKGAQYIPGVSLGVEGAGTVAAAVAGEDSDINKGLIELTQGKDWDKLTDEEKKAAIAQRNIGGALSTLDVLPVAGKVAGTAAKTGVKTGLKQGVKAGIKEGIEAGGEAFAKSAASKSVKEIADAGAGQLVKQAVKSGGTGAVVGAGVGAGLAVAQGGDVKDAAYQGARQGFVGGVVGSPLDVTGKAVKNAEFDPKATPKGLEDIDATAGKVADDLNTDARLNKLSQEVDATDTAGRKQELNQILANRRLGLNDDGSTVTDGQKLLAAGDGARPIEQVDADIQRLQTEGDPNLTPEQTRAKWNQLQEERQIALANDSERGFQLEREDARANFEKNGLPNDPQEAQKLLDDFENGNADIPTTVDSPVVGAKDIFAHDNMPVELKNAASELLDDQRIVQEQLDNLTSGENARLEQQNLDDSYRAAEADIAEMPLPRQELEYQKLNERYLADTEDLQARYERDQPKVEEMKRIQTHLQNKEAELVRKSNYLMEQAPDQFRSIDEAEFTARRNALVENLDDAKRFNDTTAIVEDVSTSPRPERIAKSDPDVRNAYQSKVLEQTNIPMKGVQNISGVREAMLNFTSPSKNIQALTGSDEIFSGIIRAESAVNTANKADIDIISSIAGRIKSKEQASQIIDYVEGKRTTLSSFDEETANVVKNFFDDKKAKLNDLGYKTLDDYFPHLFNKNDPNVKRLFKGKTTADISFGNLKKRMEEGGDYSRDIIEVMAGYSRGFNRKVYLEPALKPLEDVKMQANATKAVGDWVDGYIENLKGITEPSGAEKAFNGIIDSMVGETKKGGNHYRQTLGAQRMISAVATMGLNPGTAIRNMTQVVNTVAGIGVKRATQGAIKATRAFAAGKNSPEWKEMIASGVFDGGISRHYMADLDKAAGNISGIAAKGEKAANFMMGMIRGTDISLRAQAYWGAKAQGLDDAIAKGLKGEAAEKFAKDFAIKKVADTQFITSAADMPVKLNGAGVRSLTQLATFSIKQAEMLGELGIKTIKRADGTYGLNVKQAGNLLAAASTAALFTEALKPVIGFNEKEWIPFYDQIASIVDPDSTAGESLYRSPLVSLFAGNGKGKIGLFDAIKSGKMDEFLEDNWSQIVPAGTQIKKTVEGIETTQSGISKNPNGKVRYLQDMDLNSQLKASLFGQYSTDAGRQWIKDGFPTLTDSEMRLGSKEGSGDITFEQLPRETQQEFYDYYAATKKVTGRSTVLDEIKQAVRDGNIKKAQRIGDEYNKKAQEAMQGYFQKHQELPEELQDDMVSKLFIDVQGKIDDTLEED